MATTSTEPLTHIPAEALDRPLRGTHLTGRTLRDELAVGPVLMSFLRHFG